MRTHGIFSRLGNIADRLAEPVAWLGAVRAFLLLIYLLAAPPIVLAHVRQTGSGEFPAGYGPVLRIIESDFGGPLVWYFNNIWHAELVLIGSYQAPPWYIVATYVAGGGVLLAIIALPFFRRRRRIIEDTRRDMLAPASYQVRQHTAAIFFPVFVAI